VTRRLLLALVGTAATVLVVAGLGTLLLARTGARHEARSELAAEAQGLAEFARERPRPASAFNQLRRGLDLDGLEFVVVQGDGTVAGALPDGVDRADLDLVRLRRGEVVSGEKGGLVWAAGAAALPVRTPVVVLTRRVDPFLGSAARWFAVAAAGTLVLAALVATGVARRLTRRLRATETATRRLAAGDLTARVPDTDGRDEVATLGASVNSLATALERSSGVERSFLLSVSHDLRTPLTAIRGWAEALADGTAQDPVAAGRILEAEANRLDRLVADLLELARLRAGRFSLRTEAVDLPDVVGAVVAGVQPAAAAAGVHVEASPAAAVVVRADAERVAQAVAGLLDNAVRHAGSRVSAAVVADGSTATVVVDDDGPGIPPEDRAAVFERFWTSGRGDGGTGLGLAIVAELSAAMGGAVGVEESPLGGARLVLRFPLVDRAPAPVT
jgi:two-component system sensor histidine kinase BaeS